MVSGQFWNKFLDLPDEVDAAVASRMERQRVLYTGARRFVFVLEASALFQHWASVIVWLSLTFSE